ncbi:MAG: hypothetical protein OXN17_20100 [Candidatus Poribacteria bacterium]|nr:hypothetical protein [Candidatus Poribacteria bacterium]MDE0504878.1 hypothetical protein [Candidatus Poribacteria bacterium]
MLAGVNVKRIVITTVIVVLTVATMYAVFIVAFSFVNGLYLKKTLAEFPGLVGAEVLRAKDPPEPKVRRPVVDPESEPSGSPGEGTESNVPSNSPPKVYPSAETQGDDTRGREVNPSRAQPGSQ